jgi:hypothetical protein
MIGVEDEKEDVVNVIVVGSDTTVCPASNCMTKESKPFVVPLYVIEDGVSVLFTIVVPVVHKVEISRLVVNIVFVTCVIVNILLSRREFEFTIFIKEFVFAKHFVTVEIVKVTADEEDVDVIENGFLMFTMRIFPFVLLPDTSILVDNPSISASEVSVETYDVTDAFDVVIVLADADRMLCAVVLFVLEEEFGVVIHAVSTVKDVVEDVMT